MEVGERMKTIEKSEAVWRGELAPWGAPLNELSRLTRNIRFFNGMSNMVVADTVEGLVIIDPGALFGTASEDGSQLADCQRKYQAVRDFSGKPINTVIYTHGHVDHIYGIKQYLCESGHKNQPSPKVIAHEDFAARVARYRIMSGYNEIINRRQFGANKDMGALEFSDEFTYPNVFFRDELDLKIGNTRLLIRHGRGETNDHAWVYFPDDRILCTGDFFIWAMPNAGNPQKVQRYGLEWAAALRRMANLLPEVLAPGHGMPIIGQERVTKALDDTATFLEYVNNQVLLLMNRGRSLESIIESVELPADLIDLPYLQPTYDELEFVIRNIWRLYGGWYDGIPSHLKPASEKDLAKELLSLIGSQDKLLRRVDELSAQGEVRVATHLAEWALAAAPDDTEVRELVKRVYQERAQRETAVMAKGIYRAAADEVSNNNQ